MQNIKKIYKNEIAPIYPITNDQIFNEPLYNFYIKTAYNAACIGNFKNSFVDSSKTNPPFCALETCIRQGARCLDFEIYSFNDKPVIATSSVNSVFIKETFNYLDFKDAMRYINQAAFNVSTTSLYTDPLILNFRIMSKRKNNPIYPIIASNLLSSFGDRLLSSKYNLMNNCKNLGSRPLSEFKEKVIIIIDSNTYEELKNICPLINNRICNNQPDSLNNRITDKVEELPNQKEDINNIVCQSPNLLEFVNMNSGSPFIKTLRLYDFKLEDIDNIKHINKLSMTILLQNYNIN